MPAMGFFGRVCVWLFSQNNNTVGDEACCLIRRPARSVGGRRFAFPRFRYLPRHYFDGPATPLRRHIYALRLRIAIQLEKEQRDCDKLRADAERHGDKFKADAFWWNVSNLVAILAPLATVTSTEAAWAWWLVQSVFYCFRVLPYTVFLGMFSTGFRPEDSTRFIFLCAKLGTVVELTVLAMPFVRKGRALHEHAITETLACPYAVYEQTDRYGNTYMHLLTELNGDNTENRTGATFTEVVVQQQDAFTRIDAENERRGQPGFCIVCNMVGITRTDKLLTAIKDWDATKKGGAQPPTVVQLLPDDEGELLIKEFRRE